MEQYKLKLCIIQIKSGVLCWNLGAKTIQNPASILERVLTLMNSALLGHFAVFLLMEFEN